MKINVGIQVLAELRIKLFWSSLIILYQLKLTVLMVCYYLQITDVWCCLQVWEIARLFETRQIGSYNLLKIQ